MLRNISISCGVPQGSLLGPLLFILYINDFYLSSDVLSFIFFADDSSVFFSHKNPEVLLDTVNIELKKVNLWIHANKLSLNLQKTNYMFFSNSLKDVPGNVFFDDVNVVRVTSTKFLGLHIDEKLSWASHCTNICKVVSRNTGVIYKLSSFVPQEILLILYSTLILPYLNYGVLAWGKSLKTQLDKICVAQKRVVRVVFNASYRAHTNVLFYMNKLLKVEDIYFIQLGAIMYGFENGTLPNVLIQIFRKNNQIHSYNTRQATALHIPRVRTAFALKTLACTGPKFWNSLPVTRSVSVFGFKRKLKLHLLSNYVDN